MAKKNSGFIGTFGGSPKSRLSNVLAGDRTGRGKPSTFSAVRQGNYNRDPALGVPVTRTAAAAPARPAGSIDIRGYFGDERTGIRKTAGQKLTSAINSKPAAVVRTTTDMKSSPAPAKSAFKGNWTGAAPTAMQARAGKKDSLTPVQRQARMMAEQQVGSRKTGGGQSASAGFKSLGDMGRRAAGALGFGRNSKPNSNKPGGGRNLSGKP